MNLLFSPESWNGQMAVESGRRMKESSSNQELLDVVATGSHVKSLGAEAHSDT